MIIKYRNKIFRFITIYGIFRTLIKALGRIRPNISIRLLLLFLNPIKKVKRVGIIGCGQFSYSTSLFFLSLYSNAKIIWCYDINLEAAKSLAKLYGIKVFSNKDDIFDIDVDLVYIASNHSTHTPYAIKFLDKNTDVYIEKPISTNFEQFSLLDKKINNSSNNLYCGYNRPHSPAINIMKSYMNNVNHPFTLSCFIVGHFLSKDHWYHNAKEGNRICGNLGHWIDLFVNLLLMRKNHVDLINIYITYSNIDTPSENIIINFTTSKNDLATITFSSRGEPFEGVSENINFQQNDLLCKIDDFRKVEIWKSEKYYKKKFRIKDPGHKNAILQPFKKLNIRSWEEISLSTKIMLEISNMVENHNTFKSIKIEI